MKSVVGWIYPVLLVFGAMAGCVGLINENANVAAVGNAMFLAGVLTPTILLRKFTTKDALVGGVWTSTVLYFWINGSVNGTLFVVALPVLLGVSIFLTKYSGVKLGRQSELR